MTRLYKSMLGAIAAGCFVLAAPAGAAVSSSAGGQTVAGHPGTLFAQQRTCRTVSEQVQCGQDCRQVPRASGDGRTRVFVNECTPRYCNRTRQVCN